MENQLGKVSKRENWHFALWEGEGVGLDVESKF